MFWGLFVLAGSSGEAGVAVTLTKMGLHDDPEAFLDLFENAAEI